MTRRGYEGHVVSPCWLLPPDHWIRDDPQRQTCVQCAILCQGWWRHSRWIESRYKTQWFGELQSNKRWDQNELLGWLFINRHCICLHPFHEVFNYHQQKLMLCQGQRKRADNINSPLLKRPRRTYGSKLPKRLQWALIGLALRAFFSPSLMH